MQKKLFYIKNKSAKMEVGMGGDNYMAKINDMRVLAICANGLATSIIMERNLCKVLEKYSLNPREVKHCGIKEGKAISEDYDVIIISWPFIKVFEDLREKGKCVVALKNLVSADEMENAIRQEGLLDD